MADIPDNPVVRRIEDVVQGDRQLDNAETGTEMAAGYGNGVDRLGTQFLCNLGEVGFGKSPQIGRRLDRVQQRSLRGCRHSYLISRSVISLGVAIRGQPEHISKGANAAILPKEKQSSIVNRINPSHNAQTMREIRQRG